MSEVYRLRVYKGGILKLPAKLRRRLGIGEGEILIAVVDGRSLTLTPRKDLDYLVGRFPSTLGVEVDEDRVLEEERRRLNLMLQSSAMRIEDDSS